MGYYTRVLSTASDCMPISTLRAALAETGHHGVIDIEAGEPSAWTELVLRHAGGPEITAIERNTVENGVH